MPTIPIAYVTKWTGPVRVYRDAPLSEFSPKHLRLAGGRLAGPTEWTDDKIVAEGRYLKQWRKRQEAAQRELSACNEALSQSVRFVDVDET